MWRKFPVGLWVAVLAACVVFVSSRPAGAGNTLSRGVSDLVFHLTAYDEHSRLLQQGQGIVVGSRGAAIVSVSTLEGATSAVATMMDGTTHSIREVHVVDDVSGLAKIRLQWGAARPSEKLIETGIPQVGQRVIFSDWTVRDEQVGVECVITSTNMVPGLAGLYYVETSQPLPRSGGGVFGSDRMLVGVVVMRFGEGRSGILASNERLSTLATQRGRRTALDIWTSQRGDKWSDMAYARYMKGQVAFWQGQPETTLGLLEDHVGSLPHLKMNIAALLGETYLALDLLPEAILAFKCAIDLGPPSARIYRKLAWTYMETGQYTLSAKLCRKAILMVPDSSSGYTLFARLWNLQGEHKKAIYETRRALIRDPDCTLAHFERGHGYIGLGRYGAAIKSLINSTMIDPEYGEAFNKLGYAYLRNGKLWHAVVALKDAIRLEPEMEAAWDSLGEAYSRVGFSDKALSAFRQVICLTSSNSFAYCRLAQELMKQGYYPEAAEILREGLEQIEGSQWLVYFLGKTYYHQGRIDIAREQAALLYRDNKALAGQLLRIINFGSTG